MPQAQFPAVLAGQVITAALLSQIPPITAWKSADATARTTTTLANDPDLFIPMAVNGNYLFIAVLFATGAAIGTGDLSVAFTWPAGAAASWGSAGLTSNSTVANWNGGRSTSGQAVAFGVNGGSLAWALAAGSVQNGGTAGNLQLQWAENVSNVTTGTVLKARSCLFAIRTA